MEQSQTPPPPPTEVVERAELAHYATKEDIANLKTELKVDIAGLQTEIAKSESRMVRWLVILVSLAVGVITVVDKL